MKIFLALTLVFVLVSGAFAADSVAVINSFAFNAAKLLNDSSNDSNFFFSPYSIINAFGMLYAGAGSTTAREIEESLNFSPELHKSLALIASELDPQTLSIANRVWLQTGLNILDSYKLTLTDDYSSSVYELDFTKSADSCRFINSWISSKTRGRIKNLLQSINPGTLMILTNAIYFNAKWLEPFDYKLTSLKSFNIPGSKSINVPMMQKRSRLQYGELDGAKIIKLPYNNNMSMLVILPEENKTGLELNHLIIANMIKSMKDYRVDLWLPKFKTENTFNLNDLFMNLGVKRAFTDEADFSGITHDEGLKIDAVIHKTFIEVDEKRTEASAATGFAMVGITAAPLEMKEFHADRPFIYLIIDDKTGVILFIGRQTFK